MKSLVRTVLLALIGVMGIAAPVGAQTEDGTNPTLPPEPRPAFAIQQTERGDTAYFSAELEPGQTAELSAVVRTVDSIPLTLRAYAANAFNTNNGGFGAGTDADPLVAPTTWIEFPTQTFDLEQTDAREIPFTVTVPDGTAPGQYVAALVAQTNEPLPIGENTALNQIIRSAIPVVITVPGEQVSGFALGEPTLMDIKGGPHLVVPIENTGNVLVRPEGEFTVTTPDGEHVATAPLTMKSVYAFNATTVDIVLPDQLKNGDYVISGTLTDPETGFTDSIENMPATFARESKTEIEALFTLDPVTVSAVGSPVQFADVAITVSNPNGSIPTGKVVLIVSKDGQPLEEYVMVQNQAMPNGTSTISQRYIPATGWTAGTYTFEVVASSIDQNGTETVLARVPVSSSIVVP